MFHDGIVWTFNTERFCISLEIEVESYPHYDGDDEDGEIQRQLDNGSLVQFDSRVVVELDGVEIASDHLGASVYDPRTADEFWTAHRDPDPMNRNCSIMRASHPAGPNVSMCHYFPGMVREAIREARKHLAKCPKMRNAA